MKKYEHRLLLQSSNEFSIRGIQHAINKSLFEVSCDHKNFEERTKESEKGTVTCTLDYTSLPWILLVPLNKGKWCDRISDIESELEINNVKFALVAII